MKYAYAKTDEMPEIALCYGDYGFSQSGRHLFLLVKEEDTSERIRYYAYYIKEPNNSDIFKLSYLEKLYYEDPDNFKISNILFNLERKEIYDNSFFRSSFRYITEEEYMSDFEKIIFNFLKKASEIKKQKGELDLLNPGEIGVTPDGKMYLYLGKFNKAGIELITLKNYDRSTVLGSVERERENNEIREIVATIEEDCRVKKEYNNNTNVYLEVDDQYIDSDFYNFDYNISEIQPSELEKMIVSILPSHQRLRIAKKYEGKLDYVISSRENPINEIVLYIPGTTYNRFHKSLSIQIFKDQLSYKEAYICENGNSSDFVMKTRSNRFRKVKIYLGGIE